MAEQKKSGDAGLAFTGCGCVLVLLGLTLLVASLLAPIVGVPVFVVFILLLLLLK